jgi:hypothetical protein
MHLTSLFSFGTIIIKQTLSSPSFLGKCPGDSDTDTDDGTGFDSLFLDLMPGDGDGKYTTGEFVIP